MTLSPEVAERLEAAKKGEVDYWPNEAVRRHIGEISLVMLVGPAAIGKSTVMKHVTELDEDFNQVPISSTRDPQSGDVPGLFNNYPHTDAGVSELLDKIFDGEVVQYAIHPTQNTVYLTEPEGYNRKFNLVATLSNAVTQLRKLPFRETNVIALSADLGSFEAWFNQRYPEKSDTRARRIDEAIGSMKWLLSDEHQEFVTWAENIEEVPEYAARSVIGIVKYDMPTEIRALEKAKAMLTWLEQIREQESVAA